LYLECVKDDKVEEVKTLFRNKYPDKADKAFPTFDFDQNAKDFQEKSALTIAIEQKNLKMCRVLLDNNVSLREIRS